MKFNKEFLAGIVKVRISLRVSEIAEFIKTGAIKVAPWNRDEVKKRPGSASALLESMYMKMSIGNLLGYVRGVAPDGWRPSAEFPLLLSDGGHRYRWIKAILDGLAFLSDGRNMAAMSAEEQKELFDYRVVFIVTTHIVGADEELEDYAKEEYTTINRMTASLTSGEVLRASTSSDLDELKIALDGAFEYRMKDPRAREKGLETLAAISAGLIGGPDHMTTKKDDVLGIEFDDAKKERALLLIRDIKSVEESVKNSFAGNEVEENLVQTLYFDRPVDIASDGPFICALYEAETAEARALVARTAVDAYVAALRSAIIPILGEKPKVLYTRAKSIWKAFVKRISGDRPGSKAGSFNKRRYMYGWGQLQSSIAPALVVPVAAAGGAGAGAAEEI